MQKPLLDYSECDHVAPADLEIGRQVVQPCLGQMELDNYISPSLSVSVDSAALTIFPITGSIDENQYSV